MAKVFKIDGSALVVTEGGVTILDVNKRDIYYDSDMLNLGRVRIKYTRSTASVSNFVAEYVLADCQDDNNGTPIAFTSASFRTFSRLNMGKTSAGDTARTILSKIANYAMVDSDWESTVIVDATAGNIVITLPSALLTPSKGKRIVVVKKDSTVNTVTVTAFAGETIANVASVVLAVQNDSVEVVSAVLANVSIVSKKNKEKIILTKNSTYQLLATEWNSDVYSANGVVNIILTMPSTTLAEAKGKSIRFVKTDIGTGSILIAPFAGQTIDGGAGVYLINQWDEVEIVSDGANCFITSIKTKGRTVLNKTADYPMVPSDWNSDLYMDTGGTSRIVTLPSATVVNAKMKTIKITKTNPQGTIVTIVPSAGQTINGLSSFDLNAKWDEVEIVSDGVNCFITNTRMSPKKTYYENNNTWFSSNGVKYAIAELVGGGGGSGGVVASGAGTCALAASGGSGGYLKVMYLGSILGASHTITIGSGGGGGSTGGTTGLTGGTTTIDGLSSCIGGVGGGGEAIAASSSENVGGAGGAVTETAGLRLIMIAGQQGGSSAGYGTTGASYIGIGEGGSNPLGRSACAVNGVQSTNLSAAVGTGYGYGGRGVGSANGTAKFGSDGGNGYVLILEYF
jgi:hypothetical protein